MNKRVIAGTILILNIATITIPYTIKNQNLVKDIDNLKQLESQSIKIEEEKVPILPHDIYEKLSDSITKAGIEDYKINSEIKDNYILVKINTSFNKNTLFNLITIVNKSVPELGLADMEVDFQDEEEDTIIFETR